MSMLCSKCVFGVEAGSGHKRCTNKAARPFEVSAHGVRNGWFAFPFNFDPIWAQGCDRFIPRDYMGRSTKSLFAIVRAHQLPGKYAEKGKTVCLDEEAFKAVENEIFQDFKGSFGEKDRKVVVSTIEKLISIYR